MAHTFKVTIDGELKDKDLDKIAQTLQKSLGKWFKKGYAISVDH